MRKCYFLLRFFRAFIKARAAGPVGNCPPTWWPGWPCIVTTYTAWSPGGTLNCFSWCRASPILNVSRISIFSYWEFSLGNCVAVTLQSARLTACTRVYWERCVVPNNLFLGLSIWSWYSNILSLTWLRFRYTATEVADVPRELERFDQDLLFFDAWSCTV
jgi:hypothetical protein